MEIRNIGTSHMAVCQQVEQVRLVGNMESWLMLIGDIMLTKQKLSPKLYVKSVKCRLQPLNTISLQPRHDGYQQYIWWWWHQPSSVFSNGQDSCVNMMKFYYQVEARWKGVYWVTHSHDSEVDKNGAEAALQEGTDDSNRRVNQAHCEKQENSKYRLLQAARYTILTMPMHCTELRECKCTCIWKL